MPFAFPPFFISIHALREEGDTAFPKWVRIFCNFYPRPPRGGRRSVCLDFFCKPNISIHALREEGDASPYPVIHVFIVFLSTPSARRATCSDPYHHGYLAISIHALREEGDLKGWSPLSNLPLFLSTPSARRATELALLKTALTGNFYPRPPRGGRPMRRPRACRCSYFYPRPPRGGRRAFVPVGDVGCSISIHALREEGDSVYFQTVPSSSTFLSTPSARRATRPEWCEKILSGISIHALREEGDRSSSCTTHRPSDFYPRPPRGGRPRFLREVCSVENFYPRPPRGGRLSEAGTEGLTVAFLSTPSARRATDIAMYHSGVRKISIHALREEGDG